MSLISNNPTGVPTRYQTSATIGLVPNRFNPLDVPNLTVWLDAADTSTINPPNTTAAITSWRSKGSNTNSAVKYNTGGFDYATPTTMSHTLNGLNVLHFTKDNFINGSNTSATLGLTTTLSNQSKAAFVVFKGLTNLAIAAQPYYNFFSVFAANYYNVGEAYISTQFVLNCGTNGDQTRLASLAAANSLNTASVVCIYNSSNVSDNIITENGTSLSLSTSVLATNYVTTSGNYQIHQYAYNTEMDVAEILIYDGDITVEQRQQIEGYLAWKWGLQGNLPNDHPYKNINLAGPSIPTFPYSSLSFNQSISFR